MMEEIENRKKLSSMNLLQQEEEAKLAATEWYRTFIPDDSITCPKNIEELEAYQYATIEQVLKKAQELEINLEYEPYLLWIARMALCLPLPPLWRENVINDNVTYYSIEYDVLLNSHPATDFLSKNLWKIRDFVAMRANDVFGTLFRLHFLIDSSYMHFYDSLMREFKKNTPEEIHIDVNNNNEGRYSSAAQQYISEQESVDKENKKVEGKKEVQEISDKEIYAMANICGVNLNTEGHLLELIDKKLREFKHQSDEVWEFRESAQGTPYWISTKTKACTQRHPMISMIQEELAEKRQAMQSVLNSDEYKLTARIPQKISSFSQTEGVAGLYQQLKNEANKLVSNIIIDKMTNEKTEGVNDTKPYNLKHLADFLGKKLSKEEALDILFACPFQLGKPKLEVESIEEEKSDSNSEEEIPTKIEKVEQNKKDIPSPITDIKEEPGQVIDSVQIASAEPAPIQVQLTVPASITESKQEIKQENMKTEKSPVNKRRDPLITEVITKKQENGEIVATVSETQENPSTKSDNIQKEPIIKEINKDATNKDSEKSSIEKSQISEKTPEILKVESFNVPNKDNQSINPSSTSQEVSCGPSVISHEEEKSKFFTTEKQNNNAISESPKTENKKNLIVLKEAGKPIDKQLKKEPEKMQAVVVKKIAVTKIKSPLVENNEKNEEINNVNETDNNNGSEVIQNERNNTLENKNSDNEIIIKKTDENANKEDAVNPIAATQGSENKQQIENPIKKIEKKTLIKVVGSQNSTANCEEKDSDIYQPSSHHLLYDLSQYEEENMKDPNIQLYLQPNGMQFRLLSKSYMKHKAKRMKMQLKKEMPTSIYFTTQATGLNEAADPKKSEKTGPAHQAIEDLETILKNILTKKDSEDSDDFKAPQLKEIEPISKTLYRKTKNNWNPSLNSTTHNIKLLRESNDGNLIEEKEESVDDIHVKGEAARCYTPPAYTTLNITKERCCLKRHSPPLTPTLFKFIPCNEPILNKKEIVEKNIVNEEKIVEKEEKVIVKEKPKQIESIRLKIDNVPYSQQIIEQDKEEDKTSTSQEERQKKINFKNNKTNGDKTNSEKMSSDNINARSCEILPRISPFRKLISLKNSKKLLKEQQSKIADSQLYRPKIKVLFDKIPSSVRRIDSKLNRIMERNKLLKPKTDGFSKRIMANPVLNLDSSPNQEKLTSFIFYVNKIGNPKNGLRTLRYYPAIKSMKQYHVIQVAKRFSVSSKKDPDLLWIFHQLLSVPTPPHSGYPAEDPDRICSEKLGQHPGDLYFMYLLHWARKSKEIELQDIEGDDELFRYLKRKSWLAFKDNNEFSYYNFSTKREASVRMDACIGDENGNKDSFDSPDIGLGEEILEDFNKAIKLMENYTVSKYVAINMKKAKDFIRKEQNIALPEESTVKQGTIHNLLKTIQQKTTINYALSRNTVQSLR